MLQTSPVDLKAMCARTKEILSNLVKKSFSNIFRLVINWTLWKTWDQIFSSSKTDALLYLHPFAWGQEDKDIVSSKFYQNIPNKDIVWAFGLLLIKGLEIFIDIYK